MTITLEDVGKRFHRDWVLRHLSHTFTAPNRYAIAGPNGSGKSTMLRLISGQLHPSEGRVQYANGPAVIPIERFHRSLAWAAPYIELIEEFTLNEQLMFHSRLRPMGETPDAMMAGLGLEEHSAKRLSEFSSGMKQRVKIALALFSTAPVLLLDEPTTNLDEEGITWYQRLLRERSDGRLVIVASNEERDLRDCTQRIELRGR